MNHEYIERIFNIIEEERHGVIFLRLEYLINGMNRADEKHKMNPLELQKVYEKSGWDNANDKWVMLE